jgi:hypothetical protein
MCWALNHQNNIEMAQGHISLSTGYLKILPASILGLTSCLQVMHSEIHIVNVHPSHSLWCPISMVISAYGPPHLITCVDPYKLCTKHMFNT